MVPDMGTVTPAAATSPISAAHAIAVAMEPIVHGVGRGTIDDAPDMIDRRRRRIDHALCDDDGSAAMPAMSVTFIAFSVAVAVAVAASEGRRSGEERQRSKREWE
jgi:hypothetical protein